MAEMHEISEVEVGTSTSAEDEDQIDLSLEECQDLLGEVLSSIGRKFRKVLLPSLH